MSLDLFRPTTVHPRPRRATSFVVWPFSIAAHVAVLAAVLVIPLMAADVLPTPQDVVAFMETVPAPEPPAPPSPAKRTAALARAVTDQRAAPLNAPSTVGQETFVTMPAEVELADFLRGGTVPGGIDGGVPGVLDRAPILPPEPERPYRPGGDVRQPKKIIDVQPVYPDLAVKARVQGLVIIQAIIGKTGMVEEATVLRSIPLLDAAALAAVRQWRYTPTLLNGQPIAVIMTVSVRFTLEPAKH